MLAIKKSLREGGLILRQSLHTDPVVISSLLGGRGHSAPAAANPREDIILCTRTP